MKKFSNKLAIVTGGNSGIGFAAAKELISEGMEWCGYDSHETENFVRNLKINTLEGSHYATFGDMIIKGVNGEFYPCKPDIFDKTYEAVDET